MCRLCSTPRGRSLRALRDPRPELGARCPEPLPRSTSGSGGGKSGREDSALEGLSRALRCEVSRGCHLRHREDLAKACLVDLLFEVDLG
jgi:hypothetical protein